MQSTTLILMEFGVAKICYLAENWFFTVKAVTGRSL